LNFVYNVSFQNNTKSHLVSLLCKFFLSKQSLLETENLGDSRAEFRKFLALFIVLLIVTGAAFAQVAVGDGLSIGGWGRAVFAPVQGRFVSNQDPDFVTGVGSAWGPAYVGLNVRFSAADGRIGGGADIGRNADGPAQGDFLDIWAKPFGSDILFIDVGTYKWDEFRGKIATDGEIQGYIGGPGQSGDGIFYRGESSGGAIFVTKPVTGLTIFAQLSPGWNTWSSARTSGVVASDVYKKIQAGIGYNIPGIGLARAQYVGGTSRPAWDTTTASKLNVNNARIEAAFNLTAVENLNLDIGLKLPLPVKEKNFNVPVIYGGGVYDVILQDNFKIALAGTYSAGDFGITLGAYAGFGGSVAIDVPNADRQDLTKTFDIIAIPSFYVAAIDAKIGVDVGFKFTSDGDVSATWDITDEVDSSTIFGLGAWIEKNLGKGQIRTGLTYQFPKYGNNGTVGETAYFTWPIILTLSF
jgi:hypothetical protein